jgi:hypothetical protein
MMPVWFSEAIKSPNETGQFELRDPRMKI